MQLTRALVACAFAAVLSGCATAPTPSDYAGQTPVLDLREYFNGRVTAHGLFSGKVVRRFAFVMDCRWSDDEGVLEEDFTYSDGQKERRVWRLKKLPDGRYSGTADDVVGAAEGRAEGNAFQWRYTLRLPVDGRTYDVQFDDWMFLMDSRVMLNRAVMSKFGFRLGDVTIAFSRT
jgi:hypothetical protein